MPAQLRIASHDRNSAVVSKGVAGTVRRAKTYEQAGIDALWLAGGIPGRGCPGCMPK